MKLKCHNKNCNYQLSRDDYIDYDQRKVKTEISCRKSVLDIYNKRRGAFPDGPEGDELYDEYLEDIENMVMILASTTISEKEKNEIRKKITQEKEKS